MEAGKAKPEVWNGAAVFGPSLPGSVHIADVPSQVPDRMLWRVPLFGTAANTEGVSKMDKARTTIYRDGTVVCDRGKLTCTTEDNTSGVYKVVTTASRASFARWSTKVTGVWTFKHDGKVGRLPISIIRFTPRLDQANTAPGGRTYLVPVSVHRSPGASPARVVSLKVAVSYDDGKTWQRVPVVNGKALVRHPDKGFVSLRAKAVDSVGGSVTQTIIRAYELR